MARRVGSPMARYRSPDMTATICKSVLACQGRERASHPRPPARLPADDACHHHEEDGDDHDHDPRSQLAAMAGQERGLVMLERVRRMVSVVLLVVRPMLRVLLGRGSRRAMTLGVRAEVRLRHPVPPKAPRDVCRPALHPESGMPDGRTRVVDYTVRPIADMPSARKCPPRPW